MTKLTPTAIQTEDAIWLASREAAGLFSEMGTGKTLTALEAARIAGAWPVLIICPPVAIGMWTSEAAAHLGNDIPWFVQRIKTAKDAINLAAGVVVVSQALVEPMKEALATIAWGLIIVDEAQAFKTLTSARTKALYGGGATGRGRAIVANAKHVWLLTGTPITRWPDDLFPHFRALAPGLIPSRDPQHILDPVPMKLSEFQARYCEVDYTEVEKTQRDGTVEMVEVSRVVGAQNEPELKPIIEAFSRRRTLIEVEPDMPPLVIDQEELDIPADAVAEALAICPDLLELVRQYEDGEITAPTLMDILASLEAEHLATARRKLGALKLSKTIERVAADFERDPEADPILIFGWHPAFIEGVASGLREKFFGDPAARWGLATQSIVGGTNQLSREGIIAAFNNGELDALAGNMQALGVAANLQARCNRVFVAEPDWSWANIMQAIKRVHRIGQTKPCRATFLVTPGTTDDAVVTVATDKLRTMNLLGV